MTGALPCRMARWSTGSASPSISRNTMPGTDVRCGFPPPAADAARDAQRVVLLVVGAEQDLEDERHRAHHERGEQGAGERVDADVVREELGRGHQGERVHGQHEHEAEQEGPRQAQRRHDRRKDGVDGRDHDRHQERGARLLDPDAGHDAGGDVHRGPGDDPRHEQAERVQAAAARGASRRRVRCSRCRQPGHLAQRVHPNSCRTRPRPLGSPPSASSRPGSPRPAPSCPSRAG